MAEGVATGTLLDTGCPHGAVTEAEDIRDEEFGNERLEALLEQHIDYSATLIRDQIADAVDSFVGEAPQKDDETLVIVRRA
jgi:serine phosphatase RsbU (regulator of sigma subunit)